MERVQVEVKRREGRCPFCHADVGRGDDPVVCDDCDARHHEACWQEGGATCASCGSARGLGLLPASRAAPPPRTKEAVPPPADDTAPRQPPDLAAVVRLQELVGQLQLHRRTFWLRQWWCFLVPHLYVPFFWPVLWVGYQNERKKVAALVVHARQLVRAYGLELDAAARAVLLDAEAWST